MEGQEAARLAERFGPAVYRLAYTRMGNAADAEDVTQDVFLRLLTKAPDFSDDDHAKAWLLRVTVNRANDLFRSPWSRREPLEATDTFASQAQDAPGEIVMAVLALPPKLRVVVHLFYYEELSVSQIAQMLKVREGAVKTRLSRARAILRRNMLEGGEKDAAG